jgi:hypothetical protein
VRNGTGASTTVVNTKTLKVTCKNEAGIGAEGVRVRIETDPGAVKITDGTTNSSGIFQYTSYSYVSDTPVKIIARLKGYKNNSASDTITINGLSVPFTMIRDPAVDLP